MATVWQMASGQELLNLCMLRSFHDNRQVLKSTIKSAQFFIYMRCFYWQRASKGNVDPSQLRILYKSLVRNNNQTEQKSFLFRISIQFYILGLSLGKNKC